MLLKITSSALRRERGIEFFFDTENRRCTEFFWEERKRIEFAWTRRNGDTEVHGVFLEERKRIEFTWTRRIGGAEIHEDLLGGAKEY
jgi:hypothetical protein